MSNRTLIFNCKSCSRNCNLKIEIDDSFTMDDIVNLSCPYACPWHIIVPQWEREQQCH